MARTGSGCPVCNRKPSTRASTRRSVLPGGSERFFFGLPASLCDVCQQLYLDPDLIEMLSVPEGRCTFAIEIRPGAAARSLVERRLLLARPRRSPAGAATWLPIQATSASCERSSDTAAVTRPARCPCSACRARAALRAHGRAPSLRQARACSASFCARNGCSFSSRTRSGGRVPAARWSATTIRSRRRRWSWVTTTGIGACSSSRRANEARCLARAAAADGVEERPRRAGHGLVDELVDVLARDRPARPVERQLLELGVGQLGHPAAVDVAFAYVGADAFGEQAGGARARGEMPSSWRAR